MICVSIAEEGLDRCLAAIADMSFAEIRLDLTRLSLPEIRQLFSQHPALIATCRKNNLSDAERKAMLLTAVEAGAAYVDVDLESDTSFRDDIVSAARARNCQVIMSYHNFDKTPEKPTLSAIIDQCFALGNMAKIACMVNSAQDGARLLGLLDDNRKIIVVGMGDKGKVVRCASVLLGSPFTFASFRHDAQTAPGQIDRATLAAILNLLQSETPGGIRP
jgi:3-dehydroquinate dehydratase type I